MICWVLCDSSQTFESCAAHSILVSEYQCAVDNGAVSLTSGVLERMATILYQCPNTGYASKAIQMNQYRPIKTPRFL